MITVQPFWRKILRRQIFSPACSQKAGFWLRFFWGFLLVIRPERGLL